MKQWLSNNWLAVILAVAFGAYVVFHKQSNSNDLYEYQLKQARDSLPTVIRQRDSIQKALDSSQGAVINPNDSLWGVLSRGQFEILNKLKHEKPTVNAANLGSDELRSYFAGLK